MRQHLCVGPAISVSDRLPPEPLLTLRASVTHRERKHRVSRLAKQDLIEEAVHDGVATIGEVVDLEAQVSPGRQIIARHEGHECQSASKKDPLSACKRDPFVEQRDGYDGRAVRAGCGVGRA